MITAPGEGKYLDPCFDPYGIITQWTGQIPMDCRRWQTPPKGSKAVIICGQNYVNRNSYPGGRRFESSLRNHMNETRFSTKCSENGFLIFGKPLNDRVFRLHP